LTDVYGRRDDKHLKTLKALGRQWKATPGPGSIYYRRRLELAHAATLRHQSTKTFAKFPITFHFIWIANRAGDAYICIVIGNCTVRSCSDDMLVGTKMA